MALFGKKGLRLEVIGGIDIESGLTLAGDRVSVGTGPTDTLHLGEADVVPGQIVFQRRGASWEYFVSDRGKTEIVNGHARAGTVKPGQEYRLGASARISVVRADAPAATTEKGEKAGGAEIPLAMALPVLALIMLGAFVMVNQFKGGGPQAPLLSTTQWFSQERPLDAAIDACLGSVATLDAGPPVAPNAPDHAFHRWLAAADKTSPEAMAARASLIAIVREAITEAHFLHDAGRNIDASDLYRRLENVMPLGPRDCPILSATRRDLALLEMMGQR